MSERERVIGSAVIYLATAIIGAAVALAAGLSWWAASVIGATLYVLAAGAKHLVKARGARSLGNT